VKFGVRCQLELKPTLKLRSLPNSYPHQGRVRSDDFNDPSSDESVDFVYASALPTRLGAALDKNVYGWLFLRGSLIAIAHDPISLYLPLVVAAWSSALSEPSTSFSGSRRKPSGGPPVLRAPFVRDWARSISLKHGNGLVEPVELFLCAAAFSPELSQHPTEIGHPDLRFSSSNEFKKALYIATYRKSEVQSRQNSDYYPPTSVSYPAPNGGAADHAVDPIQPFLAKSSVQHLLTSASRRIVRTQ